MTVRINARDHFESWVVDLPAATIYMEVYNPPRNGFAAKHLLRPSSDDLEESLESRNLRNVTSAEDVGVAGADKYYDHIEVDLGAVCVKSVGKHEGLSSKVKIGGTKIGTSNKAGKTYLSFELSHCGGGA